MGMVFLAVGKMGKKRFGNFNCPGKSCWKNKLVGKASVYSDMEEAARLFYPVPICPSIKHCAPYTTGKFVDTQLLKKDVLKQMSNFSGFYFLPEGKVLVIETARSKNGRTIQLKQMGNIFYMAGIDGSRIKFHQNKCVLDFLAD